MKKDRTRLEKIVMIFYSVLITLLLILTILTFVHKEKEVKFNITQETKDRFTCPIKCIDNGFNTGQYFSLTKRCYCFNNTK